MALDQSFGIAGIAYVGAIDLPHGHELLRWQLGSQDIWSQWRAALFVDQEPSNAVFFRGAGLGQRQGHATTRFTLFTYVQMPMTLQIFLSIFTIPHSHYLESR